MEVVAPAPVPFVVATLQRYVTSSEQTVVDVGCGPAFYRHVTPGRYIGVDQTDDAYGTVERDVDVVASADSLPIADGSIDVLFTLSAFYAFGAYDVVLAEFGRVLKPGGRLILFDYNRRGQKVLERTEGMPRPKWTALGLRAQVRRAGFRNATLLTATAEQPAGLRRLVELVREELRGQWAIVTATRPE
jgi:ubiquinone/menaquinone biosynthesis C-methylase UbiE